MIEPKHTEDQTKQFDREHILLFFTENLGVFRYFLFFSFFSFFLVFSVCFETVCFGCFASIPKQRVSMFRLNWNKQKTHPNSLKESIFGYFSENLGLFRFVSVGYETVLYVSTNWNKPKFFVIGFTKQTETNPKQILFRFEPKFIFVSFEDTLLPTDHHPSSQNCFVLKRLLTTPMVLSSSVIYFVVFTVQCAMYMPPTSGKYSSIWIGTSFLLVIRRQVFSFMQKHMFKFVFTCEFF
jgi:hypothetical protein